MTNLWHLMTHFSWPSLLQVAPRKPPLAPPGTATKKSVDLLGRGQVKATKSTQKCTVYVKRRLQMHAVSICKNQATGGQFQTPSCATFNVYLPGVSVTVLVHAIYGWAACASILLPPMVSACCLSGWQCLTGCNSWLVRLSVSWLASWLVVLLLVLLLSLSLSFPDVDVAVMWWSPWTTDVYVHRVPTVQY